MVKQKTYPNGLRLIVKSVDGVFSVSCGILVGAGSRFESKENNGISHFIEHMMFKGTEKRSPYDISDHIDRIGAQINAFTTKETTCYYTKSTAEHTEEAVEVLADIFFNSTFDEAEMDKERGVIIEEINMNEDTPDDLCFDLLSQAHFGESGLGATILGPQENIEKFAKSHVIDYMDRFYTASNTVVCFAGKISFEEAEGLVDKYFAGNFKRSGFVKPTLESKVYFGNSSKAKDIEQAHLCFAYDGCAYADESLNHFMLLNAALGGGMSSRLFQKVREQMGLAYSVYSFSSTYADCGSLCVYAGVNPKKLGSARAAILEEIADFKKNGLTKAEFDRAKEQIKGNFIYSQESNAQQMLLYAKYLLYTGEVFSFEKRINDINEVTHEGLNAFIKERLNLTDFSQALVAKEV